VRVALVAPPWYTVPARGYGGTELIVALLADGLVARGHDVTLFASGGSRTRARLVSPLDRPPPAPMLGEPWIATYHALAAYDAIDGSFDVVHDHTAPVGPALAARRHGVPAVHTLHGQWTEQTRSFYGLLHERVHLVAISAAQAAGNRDVRYRAIVHNGIDLDAYPLRREKEDFLVFIGRANPEKGPTTAIAVARRVGLPLVMVVKRQEPPERAYWNDCVAPLLHEGVTVLENVTHEHKVDLLGRARALLFPIQWPEPFGLVMAEAMACGTPVVTRPLGAAVEVVDDGVTGFLRTTDADLAAAVDAAAGCAPDACRARVEERFSAGAMVAGYEAVYRSVSGA
jgi:glycosyltransferase involved in cell wall biosynthesis